MLHHQQRDHLSTNRLFTVDLNEEAGLQWISYLRATAKGHRVHPYPILNPGEEVQPHPTVTPHIGLLFFVDVISVMKS